MLLTTSDVMSSDRQSGKALLDSDLGIQPMFCSSDVNPRIPMIDNGGSVRNGTDVGAGRDADAVYDDRHDATQHKHKAQDKHGRSRKRRSVYHTNVRTSTKDAHNDQKRQ